MSERAKQSGEEKHGINGVESQDGLNFQPSRSTLKNANTHLFKNAYEKVCMLTLIGTKTECAFHSERIRLALIH